MGTQHEHEHHVIALHDHTRLLEILVLLVQGSAMMLSEMTDERYEDMGTLYRILEELCQFGLVECINKGAKKRKLIYQATDQGKRIVAAIKAS